MTCNITTTPLYTEALPLYQRDPETASIRSAAPSYVSEAPTYTSRRQSIPTPNSTSRPSPTARRATTSTQAAPPRLGLPSPRYAPGFQSRAHGSASDLSAHNYNISHWSNIHSNHQSRQYENVARRRANQAANTTALLHSLAAVPPPAVVSPATAASAGTSPAASTTALDNLGGGVPTSPLEDPYLVGEEAAGRARQQRIYREMCMRGEEAVRLESKTWDFMLGQMADWEERERSWGKFRETVKTGRTKLLGRRIGLGGGRFGV
ncbi:uncharacterized protein BDZ99DRAFT_501749 [Mytilinidion resinicola]|uniref:Uncharacterized protein n=1 Tax=Mytilinidion resinicola TaxID=574789 RepID=A0A6A6Y9P0_9PEZI|nr:uncharacterized protein BDZ99DRAFT_501749 [Mytilinidion resinicola]KAF2805542.1 hypothetical protein BDZ99DRAFT_501749 [Mytilinidion resinicola]